MDILTTAGGTRPSTESAERYSSALSGTNSLNMNPLTMLGGAGLNILGNIIGTRINGNVQRGLAADADQRSRGQTMWSLLHAPSYQMAGLRAAGINPATALGQTSTPAPTTFGANAQGTNAIGDAAQLSLLASQEALNNASARKAEVEAINASEMLPFEKREASSRVLANEAGADLAGSQSWQIKQLTPAQRAKTLSEATWLGTQNRQAVERFPVELQNFAADIALKGSQTVASKAQARQLIHSLALMNSQIRANDAMSEKTKYEAQHVLPRVIYQMGVQNYLAGKQGNSIDLDVVLKELERREGEAVSPEVRAFLHEGERLLQSAASSYMMLSPLGRGVRPAIGFASSLYGR